MLKDNLNEQLKSALRSGDALRVSTLRLLINALHNEEIAKQKELSSEEEIVIVRRQLKQREESVEAYEKGGRTELAQKEKKEAEILKEFLPAQMDENELSEIVSKVIKETGATSQADFGQVMQLVMQHVAGKADGKTVSEVVRQKLR